MNIRNTNGASLFAKKQQTFKGESHKNYQNQTNQSKMAQTDRVKFKGKILSMPLEYKKRILKKMTEEMHEKNLTKNYLELSILALDPKAVRISQPAYAIRELVCNSIKSFRRLGGRANENYNNLLKDFMKPLSTLMSTNGNKLDKLRMNSGICPELTTNHPDWNKTMSNLSEARATFYETKAALQAATQSSTAKDIRTNINNADTYRIGAKEYHDKALALSTQS